MDRPIREKINKILNQPMSFNDKRSGFISNPFVSQLADELIALLPDERKAERERIMLIPEELEKAREFLKSEYGYDLDYEQVGAVIKAYLKAQRRIYGKTRCKELD